MIAIEVLNRINRKRDDDKTALELAMEKAIREKLEKEKTNENSRTNQ